MARVHFLNVGEGDCTIIEHNSGRVTVLDICSGNLEASWEQILEKALELPSLKGNYGMCKWPTNPVDYLSKKLGKTAIWRFILSHPDMDHLDGFENLCDSKSITCFWDSGVRKEKPDFSSSLSKYKEEDWDQYVAVRDGGTSATVINNLAGASFQFANVGEDEKAGGDALHILAPDAQLVAQANATGNANDGSFVLLYRSRGGKILMPGDAHDNTWAYVLKHFKSDVADCAVLMAPHHGRKSDRDYTFLDTVRPRLTLFGCAPSEHLAYDAWNRRDLPKITNNQAGNVVLEIGDGVIDVYVENSKFAENAGGDVSLENDLGYYLLTRIK